jgi:hypothetical protein
MPLLASGTKLSIYNNLLFFLVPEERLELSYPQGVGDFESRKGDMSALTWQFTTAIYINNILKLRNNYQEPISGQRG